MIQPEEVIMQRCLSLAKQAFGATRSNPMVGSVIVHEGQILAEGWHQCYGQAHAEVNAINSINDKNILKDCTLYVNLEPCSHFGKTPPCADLIISAGIKNIVIGASDPNPKVAGSGIEKLIASGCNLKVGVLEKECRELNKRFYTFHEKQRPWIILKWAQSEDGFISRESNTPTQISCPESQTLSHQWRTEEMGILVGTQTALSDNPKLTARLHSGSNPLRIVLDRNLSLPKTLNLFDGSVPTLVFSEQKSCRFSQMLEVISTKFDNTLLKTICSELHQRKIISLIIEGGAKTINHWIVAGLWDEARVFQSPLSLGSGVAAPLLKAVPLKEEKCGQDVIFYY